VRLKVRVIFELVLLSEVGNEKAHG
jgi:hypothetical protein